MRVLQTVRILSREPSLIEIFIAQNGIQFLSQKLHEVTSQCQTSQDYPDEACDLLIEILSILYKTVSRVSRDHESLITKYVITEEILSDMQILLAVRHNVLLRCVFESILTLFEWANLKAGIDAYFCNKFTIDKLLVILETFSDDFRLLAAETLTFLFRGNQ